MHKLFNFQSLLFPQPPDGQPPPALSTKEPVFFPDLNLDQAMERLTAGKEEYELKPFFYTLLHDRNSIVYRQEVMKDLEDSALFELLLQFAGDMRKIRATLPAAGKQLYRYQRERFFLDAAGLYCRAIQSLTEGLAGIECRSAGMKEFREFLDRYEASRQFRSLLIETRSLLTQLSSIRYNVYTQDLRVEVRPYAGEAGHIEEVDRLFGKLGSGSYGGNLSGNSQDRRARESRDARKAFTDYPEMNHVQAKILEGVATLFPAIFDRLVRFSKEYAGFPDPGMLTFEREIQFYIVVLQYIQPVKEAGLPFCYPDIVRGRKEIYSTKGFDLVLADKLVQQHGTVVCNDFSLGDNERILVITGPNQGGKTTFARGIGQLHYLAALGCPVPGERAGLVPFDRLFTHFEREEHAGDLRSKLENDLLRLRDILNNATAQSLIVLNESLSSATLQDAIQVSKKVLTKIEQLDALCVWVTFAEEIIPLSEKIVSMVAAIKPGDEVVRTFRIVRGPANGLAYARSLAEKHRVTFDWLIKRLSS
jgi:DNA mismatch repair protein MutS